jgi:hypothetical protein
VQTISLLKIILILNLEEKNLAGQEKKIYSDLTFSQYNHILAAEKNVTKNILEGRTDRGKTVYPPPPSGSGGIIRSKIGSKCVDLILIFKILYTIIL